MNKHDNQIRLLRRQCIWQRAQGTDRDNGYPYRKHVPDCDICRSADLLQLYGDALVRLGSDEFITDPSGGFVHAYEFAARIEYAQNTVEVQDDPADYDICDEHETVFPRHGKCPCCDTVEGE